MSDTDTVMQYKNAIPVLPLRDVVVFPRVVISLYVGRDLSLSALKRATNDGGQIFLVTQKEADVDEPGEDDLYSIGCVANVLQMLPLRDKTMKVLVEGISRSTAKFSVEDGEPMQAHVEPLPMDDLPPDQEAAAMVLALKNAMKQYAKVNRKAGADLLERIEEIDGLLKITDIIAANFPMPIDQQQRYLEMTDYRQRVEGLLKQINREAETQKIERKIRGRVRDQVEKNYREYYLQEQMRAIQKEMGDDHNNELEDLKKQVKVSGMTEQAQKKCRQELKKLGLMAPMSAEASVIRSYMEMLLSLPWKARSELTNDVNQARRILDDDHYGLEKIKERVLEYLVVQKRVPKGKAPILCFVGPPGVGKTSLGQSIAAATQREYVRISLGGVRDEAEIRGHRRTYIGAMPGRIINAMVRAKKKNPLILLDEIDKMGMDFRGDPSSALLEVLDPEQNKVFSDHYIEVDYDLSEVLFIATANTMNIPHALMDRLEIIRLSGYTEEEKIHISTNHLIPRQFKDNGVQENEAKFRQTAVRDVIRYYTQEAGVRSLERKIGTICRKVVLHHERNEDDSSITVTPALLKKYLGARNFRFGMASKESRIGQVNGLAWTEYGGDLLSVEACAFPGKGNIIRTGKLGEVMKESVEAAFSVVRSRFSEYGIRADFTKKHDFHIHFPEGAIPKDGPSAGIAIATAVLSLAINTPVRVEVAMTGEITLRGEVLPVGGIKEKLLSAVRGGVTHVILSKENEKDLDDLPASVKSKLRISLVKWIDEVFNLAFVEIPTKKSAAQQNQPLPNPKESAFPSVTGALIKH